MKVKTTESIFFVFASLKKKHSQTADKTIHGAVQDRKKAKKKWRDGVVVEDKHEVMKSPSLSRVMSGM